MISSPPAHQHSRPAHYHHHHHRPKTPPRTTKPPRLLERGLTSDARRLGSSRTDRKALRAASDRSSRDKGAAADAGDDDDDSAGDDDDWTSVQGTVARRRGGGGKRHAALSLTPAQKAERSYHRMLVAMKGGAAALVGSKGELVLGFCGSFRPVVPWFPLLPAGKCRPNTSELQNLRADSIGMALCLQKVSARACVCVCVRVCACVCASVCPCC